ncbi:MAG: fibronectin type III domain-containing protein, partial [Candidatus Schekmanbacteria bacterium]|nr:fibronectin type III domain-containing protein [Candidatus Schekmanbacteria bacterium]
MTGNSGDGVSGGPAISGSTIAGNGGHGVVFTAAGTLSGSNVDDCAPSTTCAAPASGADPPAAFTARNDYSADVDAQGSYWGVDTTAQMNAGDTDHDHVAELSEATNVTAIRDFWDDPIGLDKIVYDTWSDTPIATAPAYLVSASMTPADTVSAETVTFALRFSASMNTAAGTLRFGTSANPDRYAVSGAWSQTAVAADTWTGSYDVERCVENGNHAVTLSGFSSAAGLVLSAAQPLSFAVDTPSEVAEGVAATGLVGRQVRLTWQGPSCGLEDVGGYKVHHGPTSGSPDTTVDAGNVTTTVIAELTAGQSYYFRVSSYDGNGNDGPLSSEVQAVPLDDTTPTPTATATPTVTVGEPSATATMTASPTATAGIPSATPTGGTPTATATPTPQAAVPFGTPAGSAVLVVSLGAVLLIALGRGRRRAMVLVAGAIVLSSAPPDARLGSRPEPRPEGVIVKLAGGETELAAALEAGRTAGFPAAWRAVGVRQGRRIFASSPRG